MGDREEFRKLRKKILKPKYKHGSHVLKLNPLQMDAEKTEAFVEVFGDLIVHKEKDGVVYVDVDASRRLQEFVANTLDQRANDPTDEDIEREELFGQTAPPSRFSEEGMYGRQPFFKRGLPHTFEPLEPANPLRLLGLRANAHRIVFEKMAQKGSNEFKKAALADPDDVANELRVADRVINHLEGQHSYVAKYSHLPGQNEVLQRIVTNEIIPNMRNTRYVHKRLQTEVARREQERIERAEKYYTEREKQKQEAKKKSDQEQNAYINRKRKTLSQNEMEELEYYPGDTGEGRRSDDRFRGRLAELQRIREEERVAEVARRDALQAQQLQAQINNPFPQVFGLGPRDIRLAEAERIQVRNALVVLHNQLNRARQGGHFEFADNLQRQINVRRGQFDLLENEVQELGGQALGFQEPPQVEEPPPPPQRFQGPIRAPEAANGPPVINLIPVGQQRERLEQQILDQEQRLDRAILNNQQGVVALLRGQIQNNRDRLRVLNEQNRQERIEEARFGEVRLEEPQPNPFFGFFNRREEREVRQEPDLQADIDRWTGRINQLYTDVNMHIMGLNVTEQDFYWDRLRLLQERATNIRARELEFIGLDRPAALRRMVAEWNQAEQHDMQRIRIQRLENLRLERERRTEIEERFRPHLPERLQQPIREDTNGPTEREEYQRELNALQEANRDILIIGRRIIGDDRIDAIENHRDRTFRRIDRQEDPDDDDPPDFYWDEEGNPQ